MVAEPLRAEDLPSAEIEADERPIEVGVIAVGDARLAAVPPLRFDVAFDANGGVYELTGEFDIVLAAPTRRELEDALDDTLAMLWREYAEEDPAALSPKAAALRRELRSRFTLEHNAA